MLVFFIVLFAITGCNLNSTCKNVYICIPIYRKKIYMNFNKLSFHVSNATNILLVSFTGCVELLPTMTQNKHESISFLFSFLLSVRIVECVRTGIFFFFFPKASLNEQHENELIQTTFTFTHNLFRCLFSHFVHESSNICMGASPTADQSVCLC